MPVFRKIFARDPANPNDIASNATITLFDPADPNKTPVALTKLDGTALANPYTVNRQGEGPAFQHETLYIVGWEGGGHSGEFDSIESMHADTLAARTAAENSVLLAQDAQAAATNAGANAGAEAAAAAEAEIAALVASGEFKGEKGDTGLPGPDAIPADEAVAAYATTPGTATAAALSSTIVSEGSEHFAVTDGVSRVVKPQGDTRGGVLDWRWDTDTGYLLHFQAGENSTASSASMGIGTDKGSGSAAVFALKNNGNGVQIGSHPSHTGKAFTLSSYGKDATPCEVSLYSGAKPLMVSQKLGAGFPDGASTNGSTTLTSATANFTSADVGATLTQTTSRGEGFGAIPTGATIASVTNSTTVVMSAPSTRTAAGINFLVGGRAVPTTQEFASFYNSLNERVISLAPAITTFNTRAEFLANTGTTADSSYFNGASAKFYTHNGTNYSAHELKGDAFSLKLRHYPAAGKGQETGPITSITATQSGGTARLGFFGASAAARPVLNYSRTGESAAEAQLRAALATLGLVTDSTTA